MLLGNKKLTMKILIGEKMKFLKKFGFILMTVTMVMAMDDAGGSDEASRVSRTATNQQQTIGPNGLSEAPNLGVRCTRPGCLCGGNGITIGIIPDTEMGPLQFLLLMSLLADLSEAPTTSNTGARNAGPAGLPGNNRPEAQ